MGVPSFYRWLCRKYPRVPIDAFGDERITIDGNPVPTNTSTPNPNNIEFDNLYLDMNGIIHPCCHPEDSSTPLTERDMFENVFNYIDRIFALVRPRKVLYMAIDGVAPRAKMNQQRQRRFRAVQEAQEISQLEKGLRQIFVKQGKSHLLPPEDTKEHWDRNVITPGTQFMADLSEALRDYVVERMTNDPGWKNIKVIFSDATVPGEGEHKILHYIRNQRSQSDYNPNTIHCLYGMDADLIMLSLASHEPHFYIVREIVMPRSQLSCTICNKNGHHAGECQGKDTIIPPHSDKLHNYLTRDEQLRLISRATSTDEVTTNGVIDVTAHSSDGIAQHTVVFSKRENTPFQFLSISILRDYLGHELSFNSQLYDTERAIDDWVFLCFFVGNDFLPHMPSLSIRDNAVGMLTKLWKSLMLKKIQPFESTIINTITPQQRQALKGIAINSTHAEPLSFPERQDKMNQIYLTTNGDVNLEALHDFISKFQQFEGAILYASSTIATNSARKKARLERENQRSAQVVEAESKKIKQDELAQQQSDQAAIGRASLDFNKKPKGNTADATSSIDNDDDIVIICDDSAIPLDELSVTSESSDEAESLLARETKKSHKQAAILSSLLEDGSTPAKKSRKSIDGDDTTTTTDIDDTDDTLVQLATSTEGFQVLDKYIPTSKQSLNDDDKSNVTIVDNVVDTMAPVSEQAKKEFDKAVSSANQRDKRRRRGIDETTDLSNADSLSYVNILTGLKDKLGMAPPSEDHVKLGHNNSPDGTTYEERYYKRKFHINMATEMDAFKHVQLSYITGLRWVLHYYYKGCSSWDWYYPYHHAPLVLSLAKITLDEYKADVSSPLNATVKGQDTRVPHTISTTSLYSAATPILPFEQLLSVFPAASSHALPKPLAELMLDPMSPIADFYPSQFGLDVDGKAFLWQGVVQLPFIDMDRLRRAVAKRQDRLTYSELQRNRHGVNYLYAYVDPDRKPKDSYDHALDTSMELLNTQYTAYKAQHPLNPDDSTSTALVAAQKDIDIWNGKIECPLVKGKSIEPHLYIYRKLIPLFTPHDKPKAPPTSNVGPNDTSINNLKLKNANEYIQYSHDVAQWKYSYHADLTDNVLAQYILSSLDRFIEPVLSQLISVPLLCQSATSTHPDNQPAPDTTMTEHTQIPVTSITGTISPSILKLVPGQQYIPINRYPDLIPVIEKPKCVSFVFNMLPSRHHICALLKNTIKQESPLNDQDLALIGIQRKEFGTYTYEYLCEVIHSKDVYNRLGSSNKDVHVFGEYSSLGRQLGNDNNNSNNNRRPEQQPWREQQVIPQPPMDQFGYDGFPKVVLGQPQSLPPPPPPFGGYPQGLPPPPPPPSYTIHYQNGPHHRGPPPGQYDPRYVNPHNAPPQYGYNNQNGGYNNYNNNFNGYNSNNRHPNNNNNNYRSNNNGNQQQQGGNNGQRRPHTFSHPNSHNNHNGPRY